MDTRHAERSDPKNALYLVLDQGGDGSRATVYDRHGQLISLTRQSVSTQRPRPHYVEQDPSELVKSLRTCINRVIKTLSYQQLQRLCCWGLVCQRSSLIGWDRSNGQPLTPVISWQDTRAEWPDRWHRSQLETIRQRSGLYPSLHHGATKMRWCVDHIETVAQAVADQRLVLTPLASYLAIALTSSAAGDHPLPSLPSRQALQFNNLYIDESSAQRTLLWNSQQRQWDDELRDIFGIDQQWLPPLQPCLADWGTLHIKPQLSLPGRFVGGDQGCAHLGSGASQPGTVKVNLGTGGFISLATQHSTQPPEGLLLSLVSSDHSRQQWMLEGTINGVGSALAWLRQFETTLNQHCTSTTHHQQTSLHQAPGMFINSVSGLGSPFWRNDIEPYFIGSHSAEQRYSAVIESILFLIQIHIERLEQAGYPIQQLELSGGVSQTPGLAQHLATLTGKAVQQQLHSEMTASGLAYLLAGQPSQWPTTDISHYQPASNPLLQQRYIDWCQLLQQQLGAGQSATG
ncbi:MAG: FGGY family carbohydrate kinase [Motiliproteus sp.]